jgi:hypothetical protein
MSPICCRIDFFRYARFTRSPVSLLTYNVVSSFYLLFVLSAYISNTSPLVSPLIVSVAGASAAMHWTTHGAISFRLHSSCLQMQIRRLAPDAV